MNNRPRVLIYRDFLLAASETFIKSQAEGLQEFEPYYVGLRFVDGIPVPRDRAITLHGKGAVGRLGNFAFNRLGISPQVAWKLWRVGAKLIHAHFGVDGTRIMRVARTLQLPLVVTFHDYDVTTSDADLLKLAPYYAHYIRKRAALNRQATAFLAVSNFIKQKAILRGFSEDKIQVHYIGIDEQRFQPEARSERDPVVLFVGRLVPKKGCADLITAMAEVQKTRPDVELVIIGDGELRAELEAQAAATLKRYRFLGVQDWKEVRAWHQRAQAFCGPSVTAKNGETEGLPIAILEAQAMGLPVVSTRHAGIPEAVIHEETGLLADEHDAAALAVSLRAVLDNPDLAGRLGASARTMIENRFSLRKQTLLLEDIYRRAIATPGGAPRP